MRTPRHTFAVALATALAVSGWGTVRAEDRGYPGDRPQGPESPLTGTFQLDRDRSDNPQRIADQATRSLPPDTRDRAYQNLLTRLNAPDQLAIDERGAHVSVMSTNGPRTMFDADGRNHTETGPNGRPLTTRAELRGEEIVVTTTGNRGSDFTVRFDAVPGGLRVSRELDSDLLQGSVTAQSFYRRVAPEPRWNLFAEPGPGRDGPPPPPPPGALVPDGAQLTARLDRELSTRTTREGEHFTLTVDQGPYRGAILQGVVQNVTSGNGRANMIFNFEGIRMADGRSGPFAAVIDAVRTPDGQDIRVNPSGAVRNQQSTGASGQDTAVGATLGAIIGAIAGGGKGAAVGAVVGGAGTLAVEGRDVLDLPPGSEITMSAVWPRR